MTHDLKYLMKLFAWQMPYGYEKLLTNLLPAGGLWDEYGNYIFSQGKSDTLFACHLDTVGSECTRVYPGVYGKLIRTLGTSRCLGGDDRAGVYVLVKLIEHGVPGTYIFHAGEETGCKGADSIAATKDMSVYKRAIEFDRRGYDSVITKMGGTETCSNEFAMAIVKRLGGKYAPDPTGSVTDVKRYCKEIREVTNISVGYEHAHTDEETQNHEFLFDLVDKLVALDWENLPTVRDPNYIAPAATMPSFGDMANVPRGHYVNGCYVYYSWEERKKMATASVPKKTKAEKRTEKRAAKEAAKKKKESAVVVYGQDDIWDNGYNYRYANYNAVNGFSSFSHKPTVTLYPTICSCLKCKNEADGYYVMEFMARRLCADCAKIYAKHIKTELVLPITKEVKA